MPSQSLGFWEVARAGVGYVPELLPPGARTYRDPEGRGPAVIQHGAVVGVLQGILD